MHSVYVHAVCTCGCTQYKPLSTMYERDIQTNRQTITVGWDRIHVYVEVRLKISKRRCSVEESYAVSMASAHSMWASSLHCSIHTHSSRQIDRPLTELLWWAAPIRQGRWEFEPPAQGLWPHHGLCPPWPHPGAGGRWGEGGRGAGGGGGELVMDKYFKKRNCTYMYFILV